MEYTVPRFYLFAPSEPDMDSPWALRNPEEARKRYNEWYDYHKGETSLRRLCDNGVQQVRSSRFYDTIRFDCFNRAETDFVKAYMAATYPDIAFFTTRCV